MLIRKLMISLFKLFIFNTVLVSCVFSQAEWADSDGEISYIYTKEQQDSLTNVLKSLQMDLYKKMGVLLTALFEKYKLSRKNFIGLKLPETLKGYDLNKKPKRIRTSQEK